MNYLLQSYHPDITINNILLYLFLVFPDVNINYILKLWTYHVYVFFFPKTIIFGVFFMALNILHRHSFNNFGIDHFREINEKYIMSLNWKLIYCIFTGVGIEHICSSRGVLVYNWYHKWKDNEMFTLS